MEPRRVLSDVKRALDQKSFQGKEDLVKSFSLLTIQTDEQEIKISNVKFMIEESKKGNAAYKIQIMKSLNEISENLPQKTRPEVVGELQILKYNQTFWKTN